MFFLDMVILLKKKKTIDTTVILSQYHELRVKQVFSVLAWYLGWILLLHLSLNWAIITSH